MDVLYQLQGLEFQWDDEKARRNYERHGVTFEQGAEVFFDPFFQMGDASADEAEQREFIIGYCLSQRLLLTVYTERGQRIRLRSARPATRAERKLYEET